MGMTVVEKILAAKVKKEFIRPGDIFKGRNGIPVDLVMSHENASGVIQWLGEICRFAGIVPRVWDPSKIVIIFDHRVPAPNLATANNQALIRRFAFEHGIKNFHDICGIRGGICHQVIPENGYILPGMLFIATDSHTCTHGALGAFAFGVGAAEMAAIWARGKLAYFKVPSTIKVTVTGKFRSGVTAKDLVLRLIGLLGANGATDQVLEFHGDTISSLPMNERLTLCNMAVEAGATCGIIPADDITEEYLRMVAGVTSHIPRVLPDKDAVYEQEIHIDVSDLDYQISCPHTVDNVKNISEIKNIAIDQVVLGSCTNGRLEDLAIAAKIMEGKKKHPKVRLLVFPASWRIWHQANEYGYLKTLQEAGAVIMNPGCGCCVGAHEGIIADGEVALATINRNFKGRMGSKNSFIYLCSPIIAAASAIKGYITRPEENKNE